MVISMITIHLDSNSSVPLYEQLYLHIRNDIRSGVLSERDRLPSARALAAHLSISRNTVDMAYSQLLSEGYVESRPKSGFYVCAVERTLSGGNTAAAASPVKLTNSSNTVPSAYRFDFSPYAINAAGFPYRIWQRLTGKILSEHGNELFLLGDRQGEPPLRSAIAVYLYEARGFRCDPDNIIIGAGADYLLQLLVQLLDFPERIAMENPGYRQAARIFEGLGCKILPVPLDSSGISCRALREYTENTGCASTQYDPADAAKNDTNAVGNIAAIYLTPSHQYPLGYVMSAGRRQELLRFASSTGCYLIEDDHDSEFRYKGKPIPALKEMDRSDSVIYIGTFSRTIAPAIRAGYMVLPDRLMTAYRQKFRHYASTVSRIDQMILARFLTEGYYERHLNKSRKIYKSRHDTLLQALKVFGDSISIIGENAGLHVAVQFNSGNPVDRSSEKSDRQPARQFASQPNEPRYTQSGTLSEKQIIDAAASAGIKLYGLSEHMLAPLSCPPTILFGYGNMPEDKIIEGIRLLATILHV